MKFKKIKFIGLIIISIVYVFGIFSNAHASYYKLGLNYSSQNLSNKDSFAIDLNILDGYENYLSLDTFMMKIKFNKNIFDFKKITTNESICTKDIVVENSGDAVEIKFNPKDPRAIPFFNNFANILKADFLCKSDSCYHRSYFQTNIVDCNTGEQLLSEFTEVTIKNNQPNNTNPNNNSTKSSSNRKSADCHLKSIIPSVGTLHPSFDPNILKYKMEVPKETQEVYFDIIPVSENTDVRVNKHRLGAPGTITYINITSKNKYRTLTYVVEVKRSITSSSSEDNGKFNFKISGKVKVRGKIKNKKSAKSKHKGSKSKGKRKNSGNTGEEEFDEDEDEGDNDNDNADKENSENNEQNDNSKNESSSIKNNKVYWVVVFIVLILSILTYLFFKKKSWLTENKNDTTESESDIKNFFEK